MLVVSRSLDREVKSLRKGCGSSYGVVERYPVAGDVSHSDRGLVGCFSEKVEKELGVLVIPAE